MSKDVSKAINRMKNEEPVVVQVAKERQGNIGDTRILSTGVKVRLCPVSASLISDVQNRHQYPSVPTWHNEKKGRDEPNYNDPDYLRMCGEVDQKRGTAALDAIAMFGVELVDGLPDDDSWITKLNLLGIEFNADDLVSREFHYKRYVAIAMSDFGILSAIANVSTEDIARAQDNFRGNQE